MTQFIKSTGNFTKNDFTKMVDDAFYNSRDLSKILRKLAMDFTNRDVKFYESRSMVLRNWSSHIILLKKSSRFIKINDFTNLDFFTNLFVTGPHTYNITDQTGVKIGIIAVNPFC